MSKSVFPLLSDRPRLLVSIQNATELPAVLDAGVDIIDLKDTTRGSLGMAATATIAEVATVLAQQSSTVPFSLALGELREWPESRGLLVLPEPVRWVKLGLAGCAGQADWHNDWVRCQSHIVSSGAHPLEWIAVAYADAHAANAPPPEQVLQAAVASQAAGFLIDTFAKTGKTLIDCLGFERLQGLVDEAHKHQLPVALAGQIRQTDLESLISLCPEIIAIRSAVCIEGDRTRLICPQRIREFRLTMQSLQVSRIPATERSRLVPSASCTN